MTTLTPTAGFYAPVPHYKGNQIMYLHPVEPFAPVSTTYTRTAPPPSWYEHVSPQPILSAAEIETRNKMGLPLVAVPDSDMLVHARYRATRALRAEAKKRRKSAPSSEADVDALRLRLLNVLTTSSSPFMTR